MPPLKGPGMGAPGRPRLRTLKQAFPTTLPHHPHDPGGTVPKCGNPLSQRAQSCPNKRKDLFVIAFSVSVLVLVGVLVFREPKHTPKSVCHPIKQNIPGRTWGGIHLTDFSILIFYTFWLTMNRLWMNEL